MHKLGVVVPYRDRLDQLELFKKSIKHYLHAKGIPFELIIVEQDNKRRLFLRRSSHPFSNTKIRLR
jgi:hypothetical protein